MLRKLFKKRSNTKSVLILGDLFCDEDTITKRKFLSVQKSLKRAGYKAINPMAFYEKTIKDMRKRGESISWDDFNYLLFALIKKVDAICILDDILGSNESVEQLNYALENGKPIGKLYWFI